jgi:hypothetical protein
MPQAFEDADAEATNIEFNLVQAFMHWLISRGAEPLRNLHAAHFLKHP